MSLRMRYKPATISVLALVFVSGAACALQEESRHPTHKATLDVQGDAMASSSDLQKKIQAFAEANSLSAEVGWEKDFGPSTDASIQLVDKTCRAARISLSKGGTDTKHVLITMFETKALPCHRQLNPSKLWSRFLETIGEAEEVLEVRDGVLEYAPPDGRKPSG